MSNILSVVVAPVATNLAWASHPGRSSDPDQVEIRETASLDMVKEATRALLRAAAWGNRNRPVSLASRTGEVQ